MGGPNEKLPNLLSFELFPDYAAVHNSANPRILNFTVKRDIHPLPQKYPRRLYYKAHGVEGLFREIDVDPILGGELEILITGVDPDPGYPKPNQWASAYRCQPNY